MKEKRAEKRGRLEEKEGWGGEFVSFKQSDNSDFHITGFRSNLSQTLAILLNTQPPSQPLNINIYIYIYKTSLSSTWISRFFLTLLSAGRRYGS
jgi:hypothetical protein